MVHVTVVHVHSFMIHPVILHLRWLRVGLRLKRLKHLGGGLFELGFGID